MGEFPECDLRSGNDFIFCLSALCVILLGGRVPVALLAPQIRETTTAVQTVHQQKDQWEHDFSSDGHDREEGMAG